MQCPRSPSPGCVLTKLHTHFCSYCIHFSKISGSILWDLSLVLWWFVLFLLFLWSLFCSYQDTSCPIQELYKNLQAIIAERKKLCPPLQLPFILSVVAEVPQKSQDPSVFWFQVLPIVHSDAHEWTRSEAISLGQFNLYGHQVQECGEWHKHTTLKVARNSL